MTNLTPSLTSNLSNNLTSRLTNSLTTNLARQLIVWISTIVMVLSFWGCQSADQVKGTLVKVERVISGQSLAVVNVQGDPMPRRVRLIGLEAPDVQQLPWGTAAQAYLEKLTQHKLLLLETDLEVQDAFKQTLGYLWLNDRLINRDMITAGHALAVPRAPNNKYDLELSRAQDKARLLGAGIWNPKQPMRQTPGEFRRQLR